MSAETLSPSEMETSTTSSETGPSWREHLDQYFEKQRIHSKVNSPLLRSSLYKSFLNDYETKFRNAVRISLVVFESSRAIPADTKDQIRETVHDSIGIINAYDAMNAGPLAGSLGVYFYIAGILVLLLSGLIWHPYQRGLLEWIGYYLAAILLQLLFIGATYWVFKMKPGRKAFPIILFSFLFVPSFLFFWTKQYEWAAQISWLRDGITIGSLSGMIANFGLLTGYLSIFVWNSFQRQQKLKKHPREEFICISLDALMRLGDPVLPIKGEFFYLYDPSPSISSNIMNPSEVVHDLERMSLSVYYLLTRDLKQYDAYTQTWLVQNARQIADDIRKLKQLILLPVEGSRQQVIQAIADKMVLVAQGNWGKLERCELSPLQTSRVRLIASLRGATSIAIPVVLILAMQFSPLPINDALKNSLTTLSVGWAIVALLNWIDPTAINQIKEGAGLVNFFNK